MLFKVGDKVRIRRDLKTDMYYYNYNSSVRDMVVSGMYELRGKIATIVEFTSNGKYHIDLDNEWCYWTDSMFEIDNISMVKRLRGDKNDK